MTAGRAMIAVASFAVISATTFLGGVQGACSVNGEECLPEQVDVNAGCSSSGVTGTCAGTGLGFICNMGDTINAQVCGESCECYFGVCVTATANPVLCDLSAGTGGDPHMVGLQGQKIDWKGEDGGWYALLSEPEDGVQIALRLTAPLATKFPERQLITGFALKGADGHSIVIQTKNPYTVQTTGCPKDVTTPCLSEGAIEITVDGEDRQPVPVDGVLLPGGTVMTAVNLPTECQPYGGDVIWANTFAKVAHERRLPAVECADEWVLGWSGTTAAPSWCETFLAESGTEGLLSYSSKHAVFRIETPSFTIRLQHGTNHQGGEILPDGRILPDLEFWQMDVHFEWFDLNADTVSGILGETIRPVLDSTGRPIMSGIEALRGEVEDYRVSGPLESDFPGFNE